LSAPIGICVLGSTGSIGTQTLQIVDSLPGRFRVEYLTARRGGRLLVEQALRYQPRAVAVSDDQSFTQVREALAGSGVEVVGGPGSDSALASRIEAEVVVAAIVGFAGLRPVLAALDRGATVALANKETLVAAGAIVSRAMSKGSGRILPVDSEHSAIFQCMQGEDGRAVRRIILTASGGPFRDRALDTFATITKDEALLHPNWNMGAKITIDSATMMNKGLEVIEARWLFDLRAEQIDVLIHPQSIVHSLVEFVDGSTKAQLGAPDMRVPIQYAMTYPERVAAPNPRIDWGATPSLEFRQPDLERFPCLGLAYDALRKAGSEPAALNAANEAAVSLFLEDRIRYADIAATIDRAVNATDWVAEPDLPTLVEVDALARRRVSEQKRGTQH
jgi:1-deoxy-D-xylulose-5-phosphate reductoisomerase